MRTALLSLVAVAGLMPVTGPATASPAAQDVPNLYCPVTTTERADPACSTVYAGRRIYFCCDRCRGKFEAAPAGFLSALPAPAGADARPGRPWDVWAGHGHRRVIHFPIALLWAAGIAEWLAVRRRASTLGETSRFCARLAALGALVAVPLGLVAGGWPLPAAGALISWHRWLGVGTLALSLGLAALATRANPRPYRLALALAVASVTVTGHLGGLLVP